MVERKAFLANLEHQCRVSNVENVIVVPIAKGMEIIISMQVCLTSRINFDYKENGGKKNFFF